MLALRPNCENCNKDLPNHSDEAMICTYECTFCVDCVEKVLHNVCPNCGGAFEKRPIRPKEKLLKNPAQQERVWKKVDTIKFEPLLLRNRNLKPNER